MLDFDKLGEYTDYLVIIKNSKTGESIQGLIDNEDLSYSTNAEIGGSFVGGSMDGFARGAASEVAGRVGGDLAKNAVSQNYKTISSTYKAYEGAGETGFSIQMHVFGNTETYNSILQKVHKYTQPDTSDSQFLHSYLYDKTDTAKLLTGEDPFKGNLIHVSIGEWFLATGLFCTGVGHSFSKYVDTTGKPLYLILNLSFIPYKLLNAEELAGWIRK